MNKVIFAFHSQRTQLPIYSGTYPLSFLMSPATLRSYYTHFLSVDNKKRHKENIDPSTVPYPNVGKKRPISYTHTHTHTITSGYGDEGYMYRMRVNAVEL